MRDGKEFNVEEVSQYMQALETAHGYPMDEILEETIYIYFTRIERLRLIIKLIKRLLKG